VPQNDIPLCQPLFTLSTSVEVQSGGKKKHKWTLKIQNRKWDSTLQECANNGSSWIDKTSKCDFMYADNDSDGYTCDEDYNDDSDEVYPGSSMAQWCSASDDMDCNGVIDAYDCPTGCPCSPVVIDLRGNGIELSSAEDGVTFDLNRDGVRELLSWTRPRSDDAWLALDRNRNGLIDDGTELFGNYTMQPPNTYPNPA